MEWLKSFAVWRSVIIVVSAVPIAILTNALRVSGTGVLSHYYGTEVADGFFHSFSGWVIYIVAFLLLFAVGWILDRFRPSRGADVKNNTSASGAVVNPVEGHAVLESVAAAPQTIHVEGTE